LNGLGVCIVALTFARKTLKASAKRSTLREIYIAQELLMSGTYTSMGENMLSGLEFRSLFESR
jgi:hypothetical protein